MGFSNAQKALIAKIRELVRSCTRCEFHPNGRALPFFGDDAKYVMIGEAPHVNEVEQETPFVGAAGHFLFTNLYENTGLVRNDFIIFNSVMCKPTPPAGKTTGKPTKVHIGECFIKKTNVLAYLYDHFDIRHILVLGNYARFIFTEQMGGIDKANGTVIQTEWAGRDFQIHYCLHPSSCQHNPDNKSKFIDGIKAFGDSI